MMAFVKWKFNEEEQAVTLISLSERPRSKCEVIISLSEDMMRDIIVPGVAETDRSYHSRRLELTLWKTLHTLFVGRESTW